MNTPNNLEWLTEFTEKQLSDYAIEWSELGDLKDVSPEMQKKERALLALYVEEAKQTIATKLAEAYKQGYVDGAVDEIVRREKARQEVEATLTNDKEQK